jgi:hypothetical protein
MRKTTVWMGALAVSALAIGCGGGNRNGGTQGAAGTSGAVDVNGGKTMTLRGCVQYGSPSGTFVLQTSGGLQGTAGGTAGNGSRQGAGETDVNGMRSGRAREGVGTYRLIATGNLDLGQNVGKEVTLTGEVATPVQENPGTTGTSGAGQGSNNGTFFRVTSMTKLADGCGRVW